MKGQKVGYWMALLAVIGLVAGCETTGQKRTEKVESSVSNTQSGMEKARTEVSETLTTLNSLSQDSTDLAAAFSTLRKQAKTIADATERLDENIQKLEQAAQERFSSWKVENATIQNADIQKQSIKQMKEAMEDYNKLVALLRTSYSSISRFSVNLNDIVKYLDLNLSKDSVARLSDSIKKASDDGNDLLKWIDETIADLQKVAPEMKSDKAEK